MTDETTDTGATVAKTVEWLYVRRLFATALVVLGAFLLAEHIYRFGFEWWDIIGHEWLGLGCIAGGVLLAMRWNRAKEPGEPETP